MIKDIPSRAEFNSAAKAQFDFSWDIVISFLLTLAEAREYVGVEQEEEKKYWENARQRILTSLIIAQQGVELAIKGRLASISPYLLIAGNPADWPKDRDGRGVSFSEFRSIDAQDLIKAHDLVSENKFDEKFVTLFEKLRILRNKAMHTVDNRLNVSANEVILLLLEVHEYLYPNESWVFTRREFLENSPTYQVYYSTDEVDGLVATEFLTVFDLLRPSDASRFFKVDKRQRLYICPECKYRCEQFNTTEPRYAVLRPNTPESNQIYCFVCDKLYMVERISCKNAGCPGNVVSEEYACCCTCGESS